MKERPQYAEIDAIEPSLLLRMGDGSPGHGKRPGNQTPRNNVKSENIDMSDMKNDKNLRSLKALADETRVRILLLLEEEEACVCELMSLFKMTQSRISHHLIMLRRAGFLQSEQRGKWNYYMLARNSAGGTNMQLLEVIRTSFENNPLANNDRQSFREVTKRIRKSC